MMGPKTGMSSRMPVAMASTIANGMPMIERPMNVVTLMITIKISSPRINPPITVLIEFTTVFASPLSDSGTRANSPLIRLGPARSRYAAATTANNPWRISVKALINAPIALDASVRIPVVPAVTESMMSRITSGWPNTSEGNASSASVTIAGSSVAKRFNSSVTRGTKNIPSRTSNPMPMA